jgi:hypothetical protein
MGEQFEQAPRSALNGHTGEMIRWVLGMALAGFVAYYTAQGALQERISALETTQRLQWEDVQRSLSRIETDLREVKRATAGTN